MILSFKTQIKGKPTFFIEKIWESLFDIQEKEIGLYADFSTAHKEKFGRWWDELEDKYLYPKLHTIRKDESDRWKRGVMIDFFINARQKNMFRFAPRIPVVSRQRVFMTFLPHCGLGFRVSINGRELDEHEVENLALNDGFDAVADFEDYFISQMIDDQYSGKIIHWTNYLYE